MRGAWALAQRDQSMKEIAVSQKRLFERATTWLIGGLLLLLGTAALTNAAPKDAEDLRKKIIELERKKQKLNQATRSKVEKNVSALSVEEDIARYERLLGSCTGKKNHRCADVMYTLANLYYDKGRDDYIQARLAYEKAMDKWDNNPVGPEPVNPIPDYSKALAMYKKSVDLYPDFERADEGYYQMGAILMLQGDLDGSKDAFQNVVDNFPNSVRASASHFRLADYCFMERDFTCALKHIERIRSEQVNLEVREMAHYRKAEVYYNRAEFDKAVELFFSYVEKCDAGEYQKQDLREEALEYLAISFSDIPGGGREAVKFFNKVGPRPYEARIVYTVGMKNYTHGQYDDAIVALQTALKQFPFYRDAPKAQQMLVACHIIKKEYEEANVAREELIDNYWVTGEWASRNSENKAAIENARNEVRRALAQVPVYYHAKAQKEKRKELFEKAIQRYSEFFQKFPDDKWKVYEFKYNIAEIYSHLQQYQKAAEAYDYVAQADLSGYPSYKHEVDTLGLDDEQKERMLKEKGSKDSPVAVSQEDAGYNAIVALDNLRKKTIAKGGLTDSAAYALPVTKRFLDYIEAFVTRFPTSSTAPDILFLAANVHYSAKSYQNAISGFKRIIDRYPQSKEANKALRYLANSYASSGEYQLALDTYRKLLEKEKPGSPEYGEIVDLAAGAVFKKATALKESGNHIGAAETYKSVHQEFPSSKVGERSWFEAGVCYEEAGSKDLAAETFVALGEKFPESDLREKSYFRAAENYKDQKKWVEAGKVFALAADKVNKAEFAIPSLSSASKMFHNAKSFGQSALMSERIFQKFPADKRSAQALYESGLIYEKGKLYSEAIRVYTVLAEKFPQSEYASEGFFAIGLCFEKMGENEKMAQTFAQYAQKFPSDKSKQVKAIAKAADAYFKMKKMELAEENYRNVIDVYEKFKRKADIDIFSVAKAYYRLGEIEQKRFNEITLTGNSERDVRKKLEEKTHALEPVLKNYAKAIELGVGEWAVRSTFMIGQSFVQMAESYRNQTLFGTKEEKTASKIRLMPGLEKYYLKAQEKFHWVVETSYEQNIQNKWVDRSASAFMEMAYKRGRIYEEIGEMFRDAPIPKGLPEEDAQVYRDVLEEKYLEALDAALPKYEAAIREIAALGVDGKWLTRIKERTKFINPMSEALAIEVEDRTRKSEEITEQRQVSLEEGGEVSSQPLVDAMLQRNLRRIQNIMDMNIDVADKVAQLRSLERDTQREIRREEERIAELKDTLGVGDKKEEKTAQK